MNEIEHTLEIIDKNIATNMNGLRPEILAYLLANGDKIAQEICEREYAEIPTRSGSMRISMKDLKE